MSLRTIVELQSLAWTVPFLVLSLMVIYEALPSIQRGDRYTPIWWMTLGICTGFIGNFVDNFYWGWPWTLSYLEHPLAALLNKNGVYPNLVFRKCFGILAAYCHIRAFIAPEKGAVNANRLMRLVHYFTIASVVLGQAYILTLYLLKNHILQQ